jgi:aspartate/methionine/tyrosine aminotransferase
MVDIASLRLDDLDALRRRLAEQHGAFVAQRLSLDMTRGKPAPEQLDLSNALLGILGNGAAIAADGSDCRNYYGDLRGLPEVRALFTNILGAPVGQILVGGNSSLALMHDAIVYALLDGVPGGAAAWSRDGGTAFLCPSPGYDRHFAICEAYGIRMLPVPLTGSGPDMEAVAPLVARDPSIKGMWCVPKYSNPTAEIYAPETVERLAAMPAAAPDFRLFWDNAYAVHHLTPTRHGLANILEACARHGHPNRAFIFASTSKMTFAGAGLALFASSPENMAWLMTHMSRQTIGPDKLNQLRHARFLRDEAGIHALMDAHRALLAPKFARVLAVFEELLGGSGVARWTRPQGGYFVSLDVRPGCARRVVELAKEAGIALVPAGRTFPYGRDPDDSNIRIAPSYPTVAEVGKACEGIALSALLAATEAIAAERAAA